MTERFSVPPTRGLLHHSGGNDKSHPFCSKPLARIDQFAAENGHVLVNSLEYYLAGY
jgi:hypothetical protein